MGAFLAWFVSPLGLLLLAVLDSSVVFFLPLALDFVVILLAARHGEIFWVFPLLATAGCLAGAATTHWLGRRLGDAALPRFVGERRLDRLVARLEERGAVVAGALGLVPPPFPFTAYVLVAGAVGVDRLHFLLYLALARLLRTGAEAWIASRHAQAITGWMQSTSFEIVTGITIAVAVAGTIWAGWRAFRGSG